MTPWQRSSALTAFETFRLDGTNAVMAAYWLSLWNGNTPPARSAFNPARVRSLLPAVAMTEVRDDGAAVCRLSGLYVDMVFGGSLRGVDMLSLVPVDKRTIRSQRLRAVVGGHVSLSRTRYESDGMEYVAETLLLPFSGTLEDGSRQFLTHTNWRPRSSDAFRAEAQLRSGWPDTYEAVPLV